MITIKEVENLSVSIFNTISKNKRGNFVGRRGYFYTNGQTAEKITENFVSKMAKRGYKVTIIKTMNVWKPFKGFMVEFTVEPVESTVEPVESTNVTCKQGCDLPSGRIIRGNSYKVITEYTVDKDNSWYVVVDEDNTPSVFLKTFFN